MANPHESAKPKVWEIRQKMIDGVEGMVAELKALRERHPDPDPRLDALAAFHAELLRFARRLGLQVVTSDEDEAAPEKVGHWPESRAIEGGPGMAAESAHEKLFAIARQRRAALTDLLDQLDALEEAGHKLPKEASDLRSAINWFLQQYAPDVRIKELET
jgi:hypothetical protein